jgi:hypothetical protein
MPAHADDEGIEAIDDASKTSITSAEAKGSKSGEGIRETGSSLLKNVGVGAEEVAMETTALLRKPIEFVSDHVHPGPCNHGTFSPQPNSCAVSIRSGLDGNKGGSYGDGSGSGGRRGLLGSIADGIAPGVGKKMSTTARLAEEHGIKTSSVMYVVPIRFTRNPLHIHIVSPFPMQMVSYRLD